MTAVSVMMSKAEARNAMDAVVSELQSGLSAIERAAIIVSEIEEREGYKALGHRSLAACLAAELHVTRQRAYQVLDEMRGRMLLMEAVPEAKVGAREAREVGRRPAIVAAAQKSIAAGELSSPALQKAIAEQRAADAAAEAYRALHESPSTSKRRRGYQSPTDTWRHWCESLEAEYERAEGAEGALDPEGARTLDRLGAAVAAMRGLGG